MTMKPAHPTFALLISTAALTLPPLAVADVTVTSPASAATAATPTPSAKFNERAKLADLAALVQQHNLAASPYPDVQRSWELCKRGAASYTDVLKAEEQSITLHLQDTTLTPKTARQLLRQLESNAELQIHISRMLEQRQLTPAGGSDDLAAKLNNTMAELASRRNP